MLLTADPHREMIGVRGLRRGLMCLAIATLAGVGVGAATRVWVASPVRVTSNSMSPTMVRGDWLVVSKVDARHRDAIRRHEIVTFRLPFGTTLRAVKRVVAIAGDTVEVAHSYVRVNGHTIPIAGSPSDLGPIQRSDPPHPVPRTDRVPPGHVFVLGDNPLVSEDSRGFGPVPVTEIVGRVRWVLALPAWQTLAALGLLAVIVCGLVLGASRRRGPRLGEM